MRPRGQSALMDFNCFVNYNAQGLHTLGKVSPSNRPPAAVWTPFPLGGSPREPLGLHGSICFTKFALID